MNFIFSKWSGEISLPNLGEKLETNERTWHILETKENTFFGMRLFRNAE